MAKRTKDASLSQESMASWLAKAADQFKEWSNSENHSTQGLLVVRLYINEFVDGGRLNKLKVWPEMPVMVENSKCLREVSELLEYLDRYYWHDLNAMAAQMLLETIANIWDRVWLFGDTDQEGYRPSWG